MTTYVVHRNGRDATAGELAAVAFGSPAHFTAMQVRGGLIRGFDLHLARLRAASLELFGRATPDDEVRAHVRAALAASPADVSLRVLVHAPGDPFAAEAGEPEVLVRTASAGLPPSGPLALAAVAHERFQPAVKHVGEPAKRFFLRQAVAEGFDDAAFVDREGRLSEATVWNLAFWDGTAVVWPVAGMLDGIMQSLVKRQLAALGVPQREAEVRAGGLAGWARGAVVLNSRTPAVAVHRIGAEVLPDAPDFVALLHRAHEREKPVAP
ncbi:aminotransferase class IV [Streptomyces sp. NPDC002067]